HAAVLVPPPGASTAEAEQIAHELDRFLAAHGDVPTYFASEAAEHLDVITSAMLTLDQAEPDADAVPAILRAIHTLKGAAYTVGSNPVGALAHRLETLLVGLRDSRIPLGPAVVEAIAASVAALRGMISVDVGTRDRLPAVLDHALAALQMSSTGP